MKFHFYKIEIESKYIYRLLNNSENVHLRNIVIRDDIAQYEIEYNEWMYMQIILDKLNIPIISVMEDGFYTKIINFSFLRLIFVVLCFFLIIMFVNSLFIWEITIDGNYSYTKNQIIDFIHKNHIKEGIRKEKVSCEDIEEKIRDKFEDISWVCVEMKGTNLIVHIKENYLTDICTMEDKPYDIIANKDGVIVSVLVRKGKTMVKVGDKVKKGEVLISGVVDVCDESGQKLFDSICMADGDIIAETIYKYKQSIKIKYRIKENIKMKTYYFPSFGEYKWIQSKGNERKNIVLTEKKIKLFGNYYLPVSIQKYTIYEYDDAFGEYSISQAKKLLEKDLNNKLFLLEQKGYKIIKKNVKIKKKNDSYILEGIITCNEPLGKVSYIDTGKLEEGTYNINERD